NELTEKPLIRGDGNDAFRLEKNTVFSPWSNPNSQNNSKQKTWVAIEIVNESNGVVTFNLHIDSANCILTSPSKPQDVLGYFHNPDDQDPNSYIKLTWSAMQEPDVISSGKLLVYRRSKVLSSTWSSWALIDSVSGTSTEYVDPSFPNGGEGSDSLQYKIRAKDNTAKLSVYSDVVTMLINPQIIEKGISQQNGRPTEYRIHSSYPNPFNPSTTIRYDLPEPGRISLMVYDLLGRKVAELMNEEKTAGYHSVTWNAEGVASGVYLARFSATDGAGRLRLSKVNKLILMK
ncbi:MAG: T9SS type A sorting domain-containing protein, partial [bacterium]